MRLLALLPLALGALRHAGDGNTALLEPSRPYLYTESEAACAARAVGVCGGEPNKYQCFRCYSTSPELLSNQSTPIGGPPASNPSSHGEERRYYCFRCLGANTTSAGADAPGADAPGSPGRASDETVTRLSQIEPCSNKTAPPPQNETAGEGRATESARGADRVFSQGTTLLSMLADGVRYLMPRDAFPANAREPPQPGVNLLLGVVPPYG